MVTHNPELANQYADRIIEFKDGRILKDSNPHIEEQKKDQFELKHTKMSFLTALRLSFNNIRTKRQNFLNGICFKHWDHRHCHRLVFIDRIPKANR